MHSTRRCFTMHVSHRRCASIAKGFGADLALATGRNVSPLSRQNTILPMDNNKNITRDHIAELEAKLSELIDMADQLKVENQSLRAQQSNLVAEKSRLIEKNELARTKVEAIITRLKSLESV